MLLQPKRTKYRKAFRGKRRGMAQRGNTISFGEFALKATTCGWVTGRQIEAARKAMTHFTKRGGRVFIRVFPDKPITKKPPETRMGSGKGDIYEYVCVVRPGRIMFEISGVTHDQAKEAMRLAAMKLPVKSIFITK